MDRELASSERLTLSQKGIAALKHIYDWISFDIPSTQFIFPLLGPCIGLITLTLMLMKEVSFWSMLMPLLACFGIGFAWIGKERGLRMAFLLLFFAAALRYPFIAKTEMTWFLTSLFSLALTQWITALSAQEFSTRHVIPTGGFEEKEPKYNQQTVAFDQKQKELDSLKERCRTLQSERDREVQQYSSSLQQLKKEQERIHQLQQEHEKLNTLLDKVKKEKESFETQALRAQMEKEKALQATTEPERMQRIQAGKYRQLREQFDEKCDLLDKTRQQLFHAEERNLQLQRIHEEGRYSRNTEEHQIERYVLRLGREYERVCNEVEALSAFIDQLVNSKKGH